VLVAGCGAAGIDHKPSLHASAERRLLSQVARARVQATAHDGTAVHAVLGEFVSEVQTLEIAGQLTRTTAANLEHEARTTAAQAAERLRPAKPANTKPQATTRTTAATTTTPDAPAAAAAGVTPTPPATGATPAPAAADATPTPPADTTRSAAGAAPGQSDQGSDSPWRGHGPGHGHRHDAGFTGWWTAVRHWIDSSAQSGGND
jgi:hypothetical protein